MAEPNEQGQVVAVTPAEADAKTRNRLLCAAVNVFDRKGYQAASVREIVEQAGVTKPALYYHFGNKEGVLVAVLEQAVQEFGRLMQRAVDRPGTARERLTALAEEFFGLFSENVPVVRVAHAIIFGPADHGAPAFDFLAFERQIQEALGAIVKDAMAAGEMREANPADVSIVVMGVVGTVAGRQLHPGMAPLGLDTMHRALNLVFDGLFKQAEQGERA